MTTIEYLRYAYAEARKSKDQSTQTGVVLVNEDGYIVARGHNDIPTPCCDSPERRVAPLKYPWVCHSEVWGILDAAKHGRPTLGLTMYSTWAACAECAKVIVMAGIKRLVRHVHPAQALNLKWVETAAIGDQMFKEAGIEVTDVHDKIWAEILFNGQRVQV